MERYFEAAAQGLVPWSEALWPETGQGGVTAEWRCGTRKVGVENDFEQVVMDEEDGSKGARCLLLLASGCKPPCRQLAQGLLYIGFLSAAVREMMLEAFITAVRSAW